MHIKNNFLIIYLIVFSAAIHSQDFDEFDFDLDSDDEMLMMDIGVDPLIFDERGTDHEEFRTFFIEQVFDYSSDTNALLKSQLEFMQSFLLKRTEEFWETLGLNNGRGDLDWTNWKEWKGQINFGSYYADPADHGQLMYDYLQPYRPISYQRVDDGSEEHFQAMTEFHMEQDFQLFEGLSIAHHVIDIDDSLTSYKTKGASQRMIDICEKIFDDEYIEFGENINALFPEIDSCDPDEVYEAIYIYLSMWNLLEDYSSRSELIDELETEMGLKLPIDAFSYNNLMFIWKNFLNFPSRFYFVDCIQKGACNFDNVTEYYIEYYFHYWLQTSEVTLGNEFIYVQPADIHTRLNQLNNFFLYSNISSEEDITKRIKENLPNDQMFVSLMLDSTRSNSGKKEERIASFYDKILQDENAIDKLKNPRNYLTQQDLDEEKYYDLAANYFIVKGCYDIRKGYKSIYVPYESYQKATRIFNERSNQVSIPEEKKEELNRKAIQASSGYFLFDNWSSEANSMCKLAMLSYR